MKNERIFWSVKSVSEYHNFLDQFIVSSTRFKRSYPLIKNISYNFQYLEFLSKALKERIHATIYTEFCKTYVVTGVSIIESLLYYIIKSKGLHKTKSWEIFSKIDSNPKTINGEKIKIETIIYKELDSPIEEDMSLDSMLKKTEAKKLLGEDHEIYKQLNRLRKLRNKIHLHYIEAGLDTDYFNFSDKEYLLIRNVLRKLLLSDFFKKSKIQVNALFDFLE